MRLRSPVRADVGLGFDAPPSEITGHAVVRLRVSTSERDASVFAYLSEVDANGRSWYITEGALRARGSTRTNARMCRTGGRPGWR
jgi:predicted acyl esterase